MRRRWLLAAILVGFNGWMLASLGRLLSGFSSTCEVGVGQCATLESIQSILQTGSIVFFVCVVNAVFVAIWPLVMKRRPSTCGNCLASLPAAMTICPGCGNDSPRPSVLLARGATRVYRAGASRVSRLVHGNTASASRGWCACDPAERPVRPATRAYQ